MDSQEIQDRKKIIRQGISDFLDDHELDISAQNIKRLTNHIFKRFESYRSISATGVNNELSSIFEYNELYRKAMDSEDGEASEELLMSIILSADHKKSNKAARFFIGFFMVCVVIAVSVFYIQSVNDAQPITVEQTRILKELVDEIASAHNHITHQSLWSDVKALDAIKQYGEQSSYKDFSYAQFKLARSYLNDLLNSGALPPDNHLVFNAKHIEVVDGDTFKVGNDRYRLWGVDAFEMKQTCFDEDKSFVQCGEKAKTELQNIINAAENIECNIETKDRYKRSVVRCLIDGKALGTLLTYSGWALDYTKYSNGAYLEDQKLAEEERRGAWAGCFVAPWDYRHHKNTDRCE